MKTTIELPDELMRAVKVRAASENRRLKDVLADVIRRGLVHSSPSTGPLSKVRFPLVTCAHEANPSTEMTPDRVAEVLFQQEEAATPSQR